MSKALEVKDLKKYYVQKKVVKKDGKKSTKQIVKAVDGVSFDLNKGEILGVIGESGCGKSTLGRLLINLEPATEGEVLLNGESSVKQLKEDRLKYRRACQMIFQNPFDTFDPRHTIRKIMTSALKLHNIGATDEERYKICCDTLVEAGLHPAEDYLDRFPFELSGGQLQRISIMRSMLLNPTFLVADEPISMLDVSIRADIIKMLQELTKEHNTAMVFISHDIATTRYISDRVAVMYLGKIVEMGTTDEILHTPSHPYTQALISNTASLDPLEVREVIKLEGEPPTPINTGPGCYFAPRCMHATERCFKEYPEYRTKKNGVKVACFLVEDGAE